MESSTHLWLPTLHHHPPHPLMRVTCDITVVVKNCSNPAALTNKQNGYKTLAIHSNKTITIVGYCLLSRSKIWIIYDLVSHLDFFIIYKHLVAFAMTRTQGGIRFELMLLIRHHTCYAWSKLKATQLALRILVLTDPFTKSASNCHNPLSGFNPSVCTFIIYMKYLWAR